MHFPPSILVHGPEDAALAGAAADRAGCPVTLLSAPAAGLYGGAGWFLALPGPEARILDCGDSEGAVLAALRAGARAVVFRGVRQARDRLADIAAQCDAVLLLERPGALALPGRAPRRIAAREYAVAHAAGWLECGVIRMA